MRLGTALLSSALLGLFAAAPAAAEPGAVLYAKTYPEIQNAGRSAAWTSAVMQPDGKVVLGGYRYNQDNFIDADAVIARVNGLTGALDPSFGTGGSGFVVVPINLKVDGSDTVADVALGPAGRIYYAGRAFAASGTDAFVGVVTDTGVPDTGFSGNGWHNFDFATNGSDAASALFVDSNGTATIGGTANGASAQRGFGLARFDATGQPVNAFGGAGTVVTPLGEATQSDAVNELFDLGGGNFAALGVTEPNFQTSQLAFAEYDSVGAVTRPTVLATNGIDFSDRGVYDPAKGLTVIRKANINFANVGEVHLFDPALNPVPDSGSQPFGIPSFGASLQKALNGNGFVAFGTKPGEGTSKDEFSLANLDVGGKVTGTVKTYPNTPDLCENGIDMILLGARSVMVGAQSPACSGPDLPIVVVNNDEAGTPPPPPPPPPKIDHYRIELKAYIPHPVVVDPRLPLTVPYALNALGTDCFSPGLLSKEIRVSLVRLFEGDNHAPYDGSFRAMTTLEFDWDGARIMNAQSTKDFGLTQLMLEYKVVSILGDSARVVTCAIKNGKATSLAEARGEGASGFLLHLETANPLVALSPTIDDMLTGSVAGAPPESAVTLTWLADIFPTHGWRVYKNGVLQATVLHNDASCLNKRQVRGIAGATLIGWGLVNQDAKGTIALGPHEAGRKEERPSPLCSRSYWLAQPAELKKAVFGSAAAVPVVTVAPIVGGKRGAFVPLATAEKQGLVQTSRDGDQLAIFWSPDAPVALRVRGRKPALTISEVKNGVPGSAKLYTGARDLIAEQGATVKVTAGGKTLKARKADTKPPVTTAKVKAKGAKATIRFKSRDSSGVAALNVNLDGKRLKLKNGSVTVAKSKLTRVRYGAVDVFGNEEALRRPR